MTHCNSLMQNLQTAWCSKHLLMIHRNVF
uniref:Uncharacterized protein n=1 Tax=Arundo donax TaxID=35708 RepID=A0A0A9AL81_ARUDO